jgi:ribosomal protein S6E (S10)
MECGSLFVSSSVIQINIACPEKGMQKVIEIDDERKLQSLFDRRISQEVDGGVLGEEYNGYIFRISGGNDKQGFPMRQGVLTNTRVRLLCKKGHKAYRQRRAGERKRKSVRGCIVGNDIAVLNLVVSQIGENTVPGLTDDTVPRRLGPKRANNIRKLFNLTKEDDVRKYVIARTFTNKKGVTVRKAPKIQRLVTPLTLQRKRQRKSAMMASIKKNRDEAAAYKKVVAQRTAEQREARRSMISKRRSSRRSAKVTAEQAAAK